MATHFHTDGNKGAGSSAVCTLYAAASSPVLVLLEMQGLQILGLEGWHGHEQVLYSET
jgi:hypothetical protein